MELVLDDAASTGESLPAAVLACAQRGELQSHRNGKRARLRPKENDVYAKSADCLEGITHRSEKKAESAGRKLNCSKPNESLEYSYELEIPRDITPGFSSSLGAHPFVPGLDRKPRN